jgi:hypothetical protein
MVLVLIEKLRVPTGSGSSIDSGQRKKRHRPNTESTEGRAQRARRKRKKSRALRLRPPKTTT